MENFNEITKFILQLSREAAEISLKHYSRMGVPFKNKNDNSRVTEVDIEINKLIISKVKEFYPEFGVLGEEITYNTSSNKLFVVDPIDGTLMYTIGLPLFGFSLAIVIDGVPTSAVLSNPVIPRTLIAEIGKGTYLVEENMFVNVSKTQTLKMELVDIGWDRKETAMTVELHEIGANTPTVYTVSEAAAMIALGGFVGHFFHGPGAHDIAAAKLIVEEAGGKVTSLEGEEQRYDRTINGAILSNGNLHDTLLNIYKKHQLK